MLQTMELEICPSGHWESFQDSEDESEMAKFGFQEDGSSSKNKENEMQELGSVVFKNEAKEISNKAYDISFIQV